MGDTHMYGLHMLDFWATSIRASDIFAYISLNAAQQPDTPLLGGL